MHGDEYTPSPPPFFAILLGLFEPGGVQLRARMPVWLASAGSSGSVDLLVDRLNGQSVRWLVRR